MYKMLGCYMMTDNPNINTAASCIVMTTEVGCGTCYHHILLVGFMKYVI